MLAAQPLLTNCLTNLKSNFQEKNRYLALSDREKRALAAERRIQALAGTAVVLNRCFQCGVDITGKVIGNLHTN